MKLWEIKAQSLRLMFVDSDLNFDEEEFTEEVVYSNPNTREKLIRMDDSIRRGIEVFYSYFGNQRKIIVKGLKKIEEEEKDTIYLNTVDVAEIEHFLEPNRIDVLFFNSKDEFLYSVDQVDFVFHKWNDEIFFYTKKYDHLKEQVKFRIYYNMNRINIPLNADPHYFDLNDIYIPEEVQRFLPLYIKSELFEEDEPQSAQLARQQYIQFLLTLQKPKNATFGKVKTSNIFSNRGV